MSAPPVPRVAVLHCPQWPVVGALGPAGSAGADEPIAIVHANRIVARSTPAAAAGVRVGQRRREAQARCPSLRLVPRNPVADARAFHPVADAVSALVPRLEITRPGVLTFATRGPSRYFGGDAAMAERVLAAVDEVLGPVGSMVGRPGLGVADDRFAAAVAARQASEARCRVVEPGGSPAFLAPLGLRWLLDAGEVAPEQVELFARLGLRRLGRLAELDDADVLARFGWSGVAARRMAAGLDERLLGAEDPPPGLVAAQHFDAPVPHLDALAFTARQLAEQLIATLSGQGRVCTQIVVIAETDHGERTERLWSMATGFAVSTIVERVRWQLDGWGEPTAGVTLLLVEPTEVRADDGVQLGLWGGRTQADEWAQRAAARLAGLVGDDRVVVAEACGGRQPDESHRWVPASLSSMLDPGARGEGPARAPVRAAPWPGSLPAPSPAQLYPEPVPVEVVDRHGRPVGVSGRGLPSGAPAVLRAECLGGEQHVIAAWAGPWLVEERWWDTARHRRLARFQLLTDDGRAYLATLERQRWWLVAEYA